jgi:hypothetical protein
MDSIYDPRSFLKSPEYIFYDHNEDFYEKMIRRQSDYNKNLQDILDHYTSQLVMNNLVEPGFNKIVITERNKNNWNISLAPTNKCAVQIDCNDYGVGFLIYGPLKINHMTLSRGALRPQHLEEILKQMAVYVFEQDFCEYLDRLENINAGIWLEDFGYDIYLKLVCQMKPNMTFNINFVNNFEKRSPKFLQNIERTAVKYFERR